MKSTAAIAMLVIFLGVGTFGIVTMQMNPVRDNSTEDTNTAMSKALVSNGVNLKLHPLTVIKRRRRDKWLYCNIIHFQCSFKCFKRKFN